ncbi:MAG: SPOR domain-containing protein [Bacteroidota bacterium]
MELSIVIQNLLYTQDFITIPELGSLVVQYQPARIIKSDHVKFIPPTKHIAFNSDIRTSDNDITSFLSKDYNISPQQAHEEVRAFVNNTKAILKEHKKYVIDGVGALYVNDDGMLQLRPLPQAQFLTDSYGLSEFHVHAIPREDALDKVARKVQDSKDSVQTKVFKALFIAVPLLFALLLIPNILHIPQSANVIGMFRETEVDVDLSPPHKPLPETSSAYFTESPPSNQVYDAPLTETKPATTLPEDSLVALEKNKKETESAESVVDNESVVYHDLVEDLVEENTYFVIVGSFSTHENAQRFVNKLKKQSYDAGIVERDNKIRVYISQFSEKNIALESLDTIRSQTNFTAAWLYADV